MTCPASSNKNWQNSFIKISNGTLILAIQFLLFEFVWWVRFLICRIDTPFLATLQYYVVILGLSYFHKLFKYFNSIFKFLKCTSIIRKMKQLVNFCNELFQIISILFYNGNQINGVELFEIF